MGDHEQQLMLSDTLTFFVLSARKVIIVPSKAILKPYEIKKAHEKIYNHAKMYGSHLKSSQTAKQEKRPIHINPNPNPKS
jgi:hypothetical protein